mmetsp:Transcript_23209/g.87860  ORF Transcript_23209/g.87860 Transcript_23209/m.87860 type:complete len:295 (-) Transcript_23209:193-1077(-)
MAAASKTGSVPLQAAAAAPLPEAAAPALAADSVACNSDPERVALQVASAGAADGAPKRDGLFVVHDAIRREAAVLVLALTALADNAAFPEGHPDQHRHIQHLLQWYREEFCGLVNSHHANEEQLLMPMLAERAAAAGMKGLPAGIAADHKWLARRTERIDELLSKAFLSESDRTETKMRALQGHSEELRRKLNSHLNDEERCLPGLCATLFTKEDEAAFHKALGERERAHGCRGAARLLHGAPLADRHIIYAEMPSCIACIIHRCAIPAYTANQARLARAIYDKGPPPSGSCCC